MQTLQVREFGSIRCGATFDPEACTVTPGQADALERLSERYRVTRGFQVFRNGPKSSLIAQNYVGLISLGSQQVEVLPKIDGTAYQARRSLAGMVAATLGLELHTETTGLVERVDDTILEFIVRLFCEELWKAVRQGIARQYVSRAENLVVVRGRLNVAQQLRQNLARPDRLYCEFDEFSDDNPLNQLLKAALRVVLGVTRRESTQRSSAELLFCLQDVSDVPSAQALRAPVVTDRLTGRYAPLVRLARMLLEGASPDLISGSGNGYAVLFDMNELFEEFVGRMAMRAFGPAGLRVSLQGPKRHFTTCDAGKPAFELRPDIVVADGAQPLIVLDTKWKALKVQASNEAVSSADVYQMAAYAHRYDVSDVVLVYPHTGDLGSTPGRRNHYSVAQLGGVGLPRRITVATISLRNVSGVPAQLLAIGALLGLEGMREHMQVT